jgi:PNKP adenylyltransferase domain, C-terminal region/PNKP adenylyltransferase domain, ligase domain
VSVRRIEVEVGTSAGPSGRHCAPGHKGLTKLVTWGKDVQITHGLAESLAQFGVYEQHFRGFSRVAAEFINKLVPQYRYRLRFRREVDGAALSGEGIGFGPAQANLRPTRQTVSGRGGKNSRSLGPTGTRRFARHGGCPIPYRIVDVTDLASQASGIQWWEELTRAGGEGMVVKPLDFIVKGRRGLAQPAVKCRGREYLRIIYGPEYTAPENLDRLRSRGLSTKRSLASREFALGIEGLERFVRQEPLRRVHECVFGVLALESQPVDPRL